MSVTCLRHPDSKMNPDCEDCLREKLRDLEKNYEDLKAAVKPWFRGLWSMDELQRAAELYRKLDTGDEFGWKDRPPTVEELKAHPREWLHKGVHGLICQELAIHDGHVVTWSGSWKGPAGSWMPITPNGYPAPWPKVKS
jgi:hypothetical protein